MAAWMRPRSLSPYRSAATVCTVLWMAPPPSPCTMRKAIRLTMFHEPAQSSDPSRKIAIPTSSTGLRPKVSASLPYTGSVTVTASR